MRPVCRVVGRRYRSFSNAERGRRPDAVSLFALLLIPGDAILPSVRRSVARSRFECEISIRRRRRSTEPPAGLMPLSIYGQIHYVTGDSAAGIALRRHA